MLPLPAQHVDHSEDSDPWPIVIEGFDGSTNEVVLESGDLLFYEVSFSWFFETHSPPAQFNATYILIYSLIIFQSSKCIHGRPRRFKGSWYSSIFVHYFPVGWNHEERELETHYAIPSHWDKALEPDPSLVALKMLGTSMTEPECPNGWCATVNSTKWFGPAQDGIVLPQKIKLGDNKRNDEL